MSSVFAVRGPGVDRVRLRDLLATLAYETATSPDLSGDDTGWPPLLHVFRPELSTRAVELSTDPAEIAVRILVCSSPEDYALGIELIEAAAALGGISQIEPEEGGPLPAGEFRRTYDSARVNDELAFGAVAVARAVDENPGKTVSLGGPVRPFIIGARLLGELRAGGSAADLPRRLVDAMRRTQWPGAGFRASVMQVSGAGASPVRLAVLRGSSRTILPDVDAIALDDGGRQIYVRPAAIVANLSDRASYLDERHVLVEPVEPARWTAFLADVRGLAVPLDAL